jgi:hypothetical protein
MRREIGAFSFGCMLTAFSSALICGICGEIFLALCGESLSRHAELL